MKKKRARKVKGKKLTDLPARATSGGRARAIRGGTGDLQQLTQLTTSLMTGFRQTKDSTIQNIGR